MGQHRKLKRFNILFDDESLLYFPGSFLTGRVELELEERTPASGLYFHIIGEGVVSLKGAGKRSKGVQSDRENYIDFRMRFLGEPSDQEEHAADTSSQDQADSETEPASSVATSRRLASGAQKIMILSPGVHTFPFKLGLPASLPSTFLGLHGWVQYYCRAILRQPSGLVHKNQQVFIIINPIDLNLEPENLRQPFNCEAEEEIRSSLCSPGGLISCKLRLDRGGFVPGEHILVSASIENASRLSIRKTRASLTETVEYRACNRLIQSEARELSAIERGKIEPQSTDVWRKERLLIPALPPTNLRGCHLIKIKYDVFFHIVTRNSKQAIKLQLPIVMATYPVRRADGTLPRNKQAVYPLSLPILRPWMATATPHDNK